MLKPDFESADDVLEYAASLIERPDIMDLRGSMARRKRDREDAALRAEARREMRAECARMIRAMKDRPDLDPASRLRELAALPADGRHDAWLRDAWPLAAKGWLDVECITVCTTNQIPPETRWRIRITDRGREVLANGGAADA